MQRNAQRIDLLKSLTTNLPTQLLKPKYNINMKLLLIAFLFCLTASNYAISQQNSIDSTQIDNIIRLINDYKALDEYSSELENRLIDARDLIDRTMYERDEYEYLYSQLDDALKTMTSRKLNLENKLKRTRTIGIVGTIGGLIVGILMFVFI